MSRGGWLSGEPGRVVWSKGDAPIAAPPAPPASAPIGPVKTSRGVCGRCSRPRAEHDPRVGSACRRYAPALSWPASVLPPGLVAIVDTREPDHANAMEAHLHRRPWCWNEDLYEEDQRLRFNAQITGNRPPKPLEHEGWERLYCLRAALPAGDYSAAGCVSRILIEWKEPGDLASTLFGKTKLASGEKVPSYERFLREIELAYSLGPAMRFVIVVPCSTEAMKAKPYECDVSPLSVFGRVNRLLLDFGVATIWAGDHGEAERQIGSLLKSAWEDELASRRAKAGST